MIFTTFRPTQSATWLKKMRSGFQACEVRTKRRLNAYRSGELFRVISPSDKRDPDGTPDSAVLPQHESGLFGVFGHPNAAGLPCYGRFASQVLGTDSDVNVTG